MILTEFTIRGLYGKFNISLKINDNKLILVAKNGASKTTILKLIYYFLTKQWEILSTFEFESITATINGKEYYFNRNEYFQSESPSNRISDLIKTYPIYETFIVSELQKWSISELREKSHYVELLAESYDMPPGLLAKFIETALVSRIPTITYDWEHYIIYLPTYRRIEEDFATIFSDFNVQLGNYVRSIIEVDTNTDSMGIDDGEENDSSHKLNNPEQIFNNLWNNRDREKWLKKKDYQYLELVEFGMGDISYKINETINSLKDENATEFKLRLSKYLAVCNKYLHPEKKLQFTDNSLHVVLENDGGFLNIEKLSSGEKQIVALFFHLYIEDTTAFVIIDEPEISLSLRWQEEILKDIIDANVTGFVVATHSPFMIGDQLKPFAHSVNEFLC